MTKAAPTVCMRGVLRVHDDARGLLKPGYAAAYTVFNLNWSDLESRLSKLSEAAQQAKASSVPNLGSMADGVLRDLILYPHTVRIAPQALEESRIKKQCDTAHDLPARATTMISTITKLLNLSVPTILHVLSNLLPYVVHSWWNVLSQPASSCHELFNILYRESLAYRGDAMLFAKCQRCLQRLCCLPTSSCDANWCTRCRDTATPVRAASLQLAYQTMTRSMSSAQSEVSFSCNVCQSDRRIASLLVEENAVPFPTTSFEYYKSTVGGVSVVSTLMMHHLKCNKDIEICSDLAKSMMDMLAKPEAINKCICNALLEHVDVVVLASLPDIDLQYQVPTESHLLDTDMSRLINKNFESQAISNVAHGLRIATAVACILCKFNTRNKTSDSNWYMSRLSNKMSTGDAKHIISLACISLLKSIVNRGLYALVHESFGLISRAHDADIGEIMKIYADVMMPSVIETYKGDVECVKFFCEDILGVMLRVFFNSHMKVIVPTLAMRGDVITLNKVGAAVLCSEDVNTPPASKLITDNLQYILARAFVQESDEVANKVLEFIKKYSDCMMFEL